MPPQTSPAIVIPDLLLSFVGNQKTTIVFQPNQRHDVQDFGRFLERYPAYELKYVGETSY